MLLPGSPAQAQASFEGGACPFNPPTDLLKEHSLRCGFLGVPEVRDPAASQRTLRLAVAIVGAKKPSSNAPVVYLAGGPGGSASGDLQQLLGPGSPILPLLDNRDWIFLDQRGTGYSQPRLACPEAPILGPTPDNADNVTPAFVCGGRLTNEGINLAAFNTQENAADVADTISALGYARADLYGVSYGSRLALRVVRDFPAAVRAMVLDGVYPPQANGQANVAATYSRALGQVFEACAADAACNRRFPDLGGTYSRLMERLHADAPRVGYADPRTNVTTEVPLNGPTFTSLVFVMLYQKEGIQLVPYVIAATEAGNFTPAESLLPVLGDYGALVGEGMFYAVECTDEGQRPPAPTIDLEPLPWAAEDLPYGTDMSAICAEFPAAPQDAKDAAAVVSDVPTLLFSGTFDPTTPPQYAQLAAGSLPNSVQVEFSDQGHIALFSGACATGIVRDFLNQPDEAPASDCASQGSVQFATP